MNNCKKCGTEIKDSNLGDFDPLVISDVWCIGCSEINTVKELLPGAVANYGTEEFASKIKAIKQFRTDYGFANVSLAYAKHNIDNMYPISKYGLLNRPVHIEPDNPQVKQIDTLKGLQRQLFNVLAGLKSIQSNLEEDGNNADATITLRNVIPTLHGIIESTSNNEWLDAGTNIQCAIDELEGKQQSVCDNCERPIMIIADMGNDRQLCPDCYAYHEETK